jgi:hypothetical protein
MNRFFKIISIMFIFALFAGPVFAADPVVIEPFTKDEFPTWAKDLRRAEIISLGSLPFVTLTVNLVYSLSLWASTGFTSNFPNLFARTTDDAMKEEDQLNILYISLGVSVVLGLVDLFVNIHKRRKAPPVLQSGNITMTIESLVDVGATVGIASAIDKIKNSAGDNSAGGSGEN